MSNQIYSHAETEKIIASAFECKDLIHSLSKKKKLTENEARIKDSSIKYIRSLMTKHWFYGYLSEQQFKELSLI